MVSVNTVASTLLLIRIDLLFIVITCNDSTSELKYSAIYRLYKNRTTFSFKSQFLFCKGLFYGSVFPNFKATFCKDKSICVVIEKNANQSFNYTVDLIQSQRKCRNLCSSRSSSMWPVRKEYFTFLCLILALPLRRKPHPWIQIHKACWRKIKVSCK